GNSGGPLVNALGEVIGMNTFIFTGSPYEQGWAGIGFAIPVNRIKEIVKEIRTHGSINRDYWLGIVRVQDLNAQIVRALGLPVESGVIITQIERGSPAYRAGLREGDLIVALNDQPVKNVDQFVDLLTNMDLRVGDVLKFTIYRENRKSEIQVKLEPLRR
ncbi:MAG: PDZ domain-containing protein, partial [Calditrichaeota bacterium]